MLVIRREQQEVFAQAALRNFENRLLGHIQEHFPDHWRVVALERLRDVIKLGVERAEKYGLTTERELYLYVSLMLYLGSYFDIDVQLPWAAATLGDADIADPYERIVKTYDTAMNYLDQVAGLDNEYWKLALRRVSDGLPDSLQPSSSRTSRRYLLSVFAWLYPEKRDFVGDDHLRRLIEQGAEPILRYGIATQRGAILYTGLMFVLGQGVDRDPQYPWVAEILTDPKLADPEAKAKMLYRYIKKILPIQKGNGQAR